MVLFLPGTRPIPGKEYQKNCMQVSHWFVLSPFRKSSGMRDSRFATKFGSLRLRGFQELGTCGFQIGRPWML